MLNGWYTYTDIFKDVHIIKFQSLIGAGAPVEPGHDETGEWLVLFSDAVANRSD